MTSLHHSLPINIRPNYRGHAAENTSPNFNWPFSISDIDLPGANRRRKRIIFRRVVVRVAAVIALVLALGVAWELPRPGIWLLPVPLPADLTAAGLTSPRVTALLLEKIGIALRTHHRAEAPTTVRMEPPAPSFVAAARWLRASAGLPDARLTVAISRQPQHWEIAVRDTRDGGAVATRFGLDADLNNRLTSSAAQAAVLLLAPAVVADRLLADPAAMQDTVRLAHVNAALARHGDVIANDPRFHLIRGKDHAARGDHDGAIAAYSTAVAIAPTQARAFLFAAQSHAALGQRERALENLRHGKARSGQSPHDLTLAGALHVALAEPRPALALLAQSYGLDPGYPATHVAIGNALVALHRPRQAVGWLEQHPPATEDARADYVGALALAYIRSGGGPQAALMLTELRQTRNPRSEAIEAELAMASKQFDTALAKFRVVRATSPRDLRARAGIGEALLGLGRVPDAQAEFAACRKAAPYHAPCARGLGVALRMTDDADAALATLQVAEQLDPDDPAIAREISVTLRALGRRPEGTQAAARAMELETRGAQPYVPALSVVFAAAPVSRHGTMVPFSQQKQADAGLTLLPCHTQGAPGGSRCRQSKTDAARRAHQATRQWAVYVDAAGPAYAAQGGSDRPRGNG